MLKKAKYIGNYFGVKSFLPTFAPQNILENTCYEQIITQNWIWQQNGQLTQSNLMY